MYLLRGILAGLIVSVATGFAWSFLSPYIPSIFFLPWIALAATGYLIGEGISLSVNRKRGRVLQIVALVSVFICFTVVALFFRPDINNSIFGLLSLAAAAYIATSRLH